MIAIEVLLLGGLPLILCALCGFSIWQNQARIDKISRFLLTFNTIFCILLWGCIYIEHYTGGSLYIFDLAAPLISVIALIVLPITNITHFRRQLKRRLKLCQIEIILTYLLSIVSLLPGLFGLVFFMLLINSDR